MQEQEKLNQIFPRGICVVTPLQPRELKVRDELPLQRARAEEPELALCVCFRELTSSARLGPAPWKVQPRALPRRNGEPLGGRGTGGGPRDPYACAHPSRSPWLSFGLKNPEADASLGILGQF